MTNRMDRTERADRLNALPHADQAREHLTQKIREGVNEYWPTTPSWDQGDHFQHAIRTDAAAATGHALLAIHEDLAGLRDDLAEGRMEAARRHSQAWQHTQSMADSLAKLGPAGALIAAEMAALRHEVAALDKSLTGIAEAVRELAAVQRRPRRRWSLSRRREEFDSSCDRAISNGGADR